MAVAALHFEFAGNLPSFPVPVPCSSSAAKHSSTSNRSEALVCRQLRRVDQIIDDNDFVGIGVLVAVAAHRRSHRINRCSAITIYTSVMLRSPYAPGDHCKGVGGLLPVGYPFIV